MSFIHYLFIKCQFYTRHCAGNIKITKKYLASILQFFIKWNLHDWHLMQAPITVFIRPLKKFLTRQITLAILILLSVSLIPIKLNHFIFTYLGKGGFRSVRRNFFQTNPILAVAFFFFLTQLHKFRTANIYVRIKQKVSNVPQCRLNIEIPRDQEKSILRWGWIIVSTMTLHPIHIYKHHTHTHTQTNRISMWENQVTAIFLN